MDFFIRYINYIIPTIFAVLIIWNIVLHIKLLQINKKLKIFFNGKKASDLEGVLFEAIKRLKQSEENNKKIFESINKLQKLTYKSIKKVGIVRFNPFQDTGGDQSFSIALLDSYNNGLVISSLYTREGTRIYSKPVEKGSSKYPFSKEEQKVLEQIGVKTRNEKRK
ncbi:MAG: DUF4446 family protein [bacterium]